VADRGSVALTADSRVDPHLFANKDDAARLGPELGERSGAEELENLFKAYLVSVEVSEGDRLDVIPYLARLRPNLPSGAPLLREDLTSPCMIELIWSYWHEQGLLAETMRAISLRFQNKRIRTDYDPLAVFELSHLQPLNSLL
jgi:hypothetical protein